MVDQTQTQSTQNATQTTVPNPANPDTSMVFDSTPTTQALTVPTQTTSPAPAPAPASGMVFDSQPTAVPITVPATTAPTVPTQDNPYLDISQDDSLGMQVLKGTNAVGAGIGEGLLGTLNGGANLLGLPHATLQAREDELKQENAQNPYLRGTGLGAESLAEFLSGDEILKGLTTSQKYIKIGKLLEQVEGSPVMTRIVNAGVRALQGGIVGGTQGLIKSGGNIVDAVTTGLSAGLGNALIPEAWDAIKATPGLVSKGIQAIRAATDSEAVQDALQNTIRSILAKTANENKVPAPSAQSLRDAAGEVGNSVKAQASKLYRALDESIGGTRFQTFDEQLSAVRDELRNSANIDHDAHGEILERYNALEDAKHAAEQQAIENGVDPATIHEANAKWRTGSAMLDLQKDLQMAAHGLRPELHAGLQPGQVAAPETINTSTLATRANRSYNSGRLMQALNPQNADDLLRAVESAALREKQLGANQARLSTILKTAAKTVGAGALGAATYQGVRLLNQ